MEKAKTYWQRLENLIDFIVRSKYVMLIALVAILVLNAFYKFYFLDQMHIHEDEAFSIFHSQKPLNELYAELSKEANPPLYFTLLHFWIGLFGIGPIAVQSLSALFSIVSAFFIFLIGRRFGGFYAAVFPSLLFLLSNLHFDFSHMARAFSLVFLLSSISIYLLLRLMEKPSTKVLVLFVFVNAALPYTHYTSVLLPLTEFMILFFVLPDKSKFIKIASSFFVSAVLFLPQFLKFKNSIPDDNFWLQKPTPSDLEFVLTTLTGHDPTHNLIFYSLLVSLLLMIINIFYPVFKKGFKYWYLLLFTAIYFVPVLLNYYLAQYTPVFRLRYMLYSGIGPLLALGYAIAHLRSSHILKIAFMLLLILKFKQGFSPKNRETFKWEDASEAVISNYQEDVTYYVVPEWRLIDFSYYFNPSAFQDYAQFTERMAELNVFGANQNSDFLEDLDGSDVVLILCNPKDSDPNESIQKRLDRDGYTTLNKLFESHEINVETWKK